MFWSLKLLTPEPRTNAPVKQIIPYPVGPLRWLLRAPLLLHRLGLGVVLRRARLMVLTTRGSKSDLPRHTPVEYRMHGSKIYIVSGWGDRPHWVGNLLADPHVTVQIGQRQHAAFATVVNDSHEALRALFLFRKVAPAIYDAILARLTNAENVDARQLPALASQVTVIRLDIEAGAPPLPGLNADLRWVPPVLALGSGAVITAALVRRGGDR